MIRVNLARNRVGEVGGARGEEGTSAQSFAAASTADNRAMIVKLALISIFTIGLWVYESQNIGELNSRQVLLINQSTALETTAAEKRTQAEGVKDFEIKAREMNDKLSLLTMLSKLRLREVKTLDFVQSTIPEKIWFKTLNYSSDKGQVGGGAYKLNGSAIVTDELADFVKKLEDSPYLSDVIVIKNQEVVIPGKGMTLRDFQITAKVEATQ